ncbi:aminocyclopropane carboxylate synthase [Naegleria gruberi]|uniref:Aminocyclopropane carboxylate synthase n=1 Tax=Naegleria gruberi TaxID=5762 RepID=D2V1P8_NAEGR|nr:aminocyclopropane carboxylate synthase [Naegleria gruberi]EFC49199.1 aminocyclopropane carboxylate synthase [Naegleria gruberi]|eukprot:XP_002681943.1 aminocyclopropane carboxylate synthase [Naegleria gruberi strain NEG-M]
MPSLSKRSEHFSVNPSFVLAMGKVFSNVYHPENNPNGIINLAVAENVLVSDWLCKTFHQVAVDSPLLPINLNYTNFCGENNFRKYLVDNLMNKHIFKRLGNSEFDKEFANINNYYLCNGAGNVIEMLAATICDAGEYIMVPAPLYLGFENDFNKRFFAKVLPVDMEFDSSSNTYKLTVEKVRETYEEHSKTKSIRGFLLCNPNNPTGDLFGSAIVRQLIDFCKEKNIHYISDELYALSVFDPNTSFESVSNVMTEDDRNHVHVIYSFSKDLCLNGFRMGVLFTMNTGVKAVFDSCSYFMGVSSGTQHMMANFLKNEEYVENYLNLNKSKLLEQYTMMCDYFKQHDITYVDAKAGLFVWFNLERQMKKYLTRKHPEIDVSLPLTEQEEYEVWLDAIDIAAVNVSAGSFFKTKQFGWLRICFTSAHWPTMKIGLDRLFNLLNH